MSRFRSPCTLGMNRLSVYIKHSVALLALAVVIAGCSGFTPVELRNEREEGPQKGIFSGSAGEFVIFSYTPPEKKPEKREESAEVRE